MFTIVVIFLAGFMAEGSLTFSESGILIVGIPHLMGVYNNVINLVFWDSPILFGHRGLLGLSSFLAQVLCCIRLQLLRVQVIKIDVPEHTL